MDRGAVLDTVSRFRRALEARGIRVERIVLFGSHATGGAREGSDIDVVVVSEDFAGSSYWERLEILSDAIYDVFEPIEALAMTSEEWEEGASPVVEYARMGQVIE